jgi:ribonuclease VapC
VALIVLDSSAIVAILRDEPDGPALRACLKAHRPRRISDFTALELMVVMYRRFGEEGSRLAEEFLRRFAVTRVAVDARIADEALRAYQRYGKGGGHTAQLNMGDCIAYATARLQKAPLLFKGNDFRQTDIRLPRIAAPP